MILIVVSIVVVLSVLMWVGYRLLQKPVELDKNARPDPIFDELKSLHTIKVDMVSAKVLYRKTMGMCLLFYTYFCLLGGLSGVLDYLTRESSGYFDLTSLVTIFGYVGFVGLFYFLGVFGCSWYYNVFKYGIAPNMQYGDNLLSFMVERGKKLWVWHFILYTFIYIVLRIFSGHGVISVFATTFIFIPAVIIYLNMEISRIGIPNLLNTFKSIINTNK